MKFKNIISSVALILTGFIFAAGLEYASAWTGPGNNTPPSGNVSAPINASANAQAKSGNLALGTSTTQSSVLDVEGSGYIQGLIIGSAFQFLPGAGTGKVLQSNSQGYASWVATSTLNISAGGSSSSGVGQVKAGTGVTLSPSTGTGTVTVTNAGVTSLAGATNVTPSASTGAVTLDVAGTLVGGCSTNMDEEGGTINSSDWGTASYSGGSCTASGATCQTINWS